MFGFGEAQDQYQAFDQTEQPHEADWTHEGLAGAAAFVGMRAWENEQRKEGKPVDHSVAKEMLAGLAGVAADRMMETKGMDFIDRERAKHQAKRQVEHLYDEQYGQYDQYDPNAQPMHPALEQVDVTKYDFNSYNNNY